MKNVLKGDYFIVIECNTKRFNNLGCVKDFIYYNRKKNSICKL